MALCNLNFENTAYEISYELTNLKAQKSLLILHGWGANKELMKQAFNPVLSEYKCLYLDLAGFGKSNSPISLDTKGYARLIEAFLKHLHFTPNALMGHSFGGKICALLSLSQNAELLILLSSAGIIWQKSLKTKFKIKLFKALKALGLGKFYTLFASKDAQNLSPLMYETFKKVVDEDFSEIFAGIPCKTLIFWGQDDKATPLKSGEKIASLIKENEFYPLKGDHFFFLKHAEFIAKIIHKNLEQS
ncbi:2-hydroxy-6-oxohepta-2,4-dienoate hydrolase [Campylobacter sp. MIT 12-5580]|uniref:alpha/beta fold hydrolase n=1 Tax=Campylobacter sp. MIT 12-5580 TaxID=2040651 RepID=UPI0010F64B7D|nr:alpha/beta hydrolase [Campylobacter sp. MIT 12-5580]TKX28796.1 2-hydroxy-6-oxohepta-2,4-dienoate hydrolase [Campylobacter sp. MIT 12-5580]